MFSLADYAADIYCYISCWVFSNDMNNSISFICVFHIEHACYLPFHISYSDIT